MTKSSCNALSTVCRSSDADIAAELQRRLLRAVAHLGIAAQAAARAASSRCIARCRVEPPARSMSASFSAQIGRQRAAASHRRVTLSEPVSLILVSSDTFTGLREIQARAFDLAATAAPAAPSPPAGCRDPRRRCWHRAARIRADQTATAGELRRATRAVRRRGRRGCGRWRRAGGGAWRY